MNLEALLEEALSRVTNSRCKEAMRYSLMAGGKRIRPTLLFEVLQGYGVDPNKGKEFACAIEMIHTYSLIHDDLPAMDNDDLRRGRPTNHKQFDEATAILAGDGLLTEAFHMASSADLPAEVIVKGIRILSEMAGPDGMVYGQVLDMNEDPDSTYEDIRKVHKYKTGCLLSAPLMIGAVIAGQDDATVNAWHETGDCLGLAFQIQDDILDITRTAEDLGKSNSDARNDKVTVVKLLGEEASRRNVSELFAECRSRMNQFRGFDSASMIHMVDQIEARMK